MVPLPRHEVPRLSHYTTAWRPVRWSGNAIRQGRDAADRSSRYGRSESRGQDAAQCGGRRVWCPALVRWINRIAFASRWPPVACVSFGDVSPFPATGSGISHQKTASENKRAASHGSSLWKSPALVNWAGAPDHSVLFSAVVSPQLAFTILDRNLRQPEAVSNAVSPTANCRKVAGSGTLAGPLAEPNRLSTIPASSELAV